MSVKQLAEFIAPYTTFFVIIPVVVYVLGYCSLLGYLEHLRIGYIVSHANQVQYLHGSFET